MITATSKYDLTRLVNSIMAGTHGLPLVMDTKGAWAVLWSAEEYPKLTIDLQCCRYTYPNAEALPSEDFRCPHGEWLVKYG